LRMECQKNCNTEKYTRLGHFKNITGYVTGWSIIKTSIQNKKCI
jgi:hypothetical protein